MLSISFPHSKFNGAMYVVQGLNFLLLLFLLLMHFTPIHIFFFFLLTKIFTISIPTTTLLPFELIKFHMSKAQLLVNINTLNRISDYLPTVITILCSVHFVLVMRVT
ncbi:hypothetical protein AAZX31_11G194400 [Glycine max]